MAKGKLTKESPYKIPLVHLAAIKAGGSIISSLINTSGGQKQTPGLAGAEAKRDALMRKYQAQQFDFVNPYEDVTVNLQAAQLQQQGLAQSQADILEQLRGGASGAGAAALATGLSRQAAKAQREISADIGKQESDINIKKAEAEAAGQLAKQQFEIDRMQTMLGMSMEQVGAIRAGELQKQQNKAATTGAIIGAVGSIAGSALGNEALFD